MKAKNPILKALFLAFSLGALPTQPVMASAYFAPAQQQFERFMQKLSSIKQVSVAQARALWVYGYKTVENARRSVLRQPKLQISQEETDAFWQALKTTGITLTALVGIVAAVTGIGYSIRKSRQDLKKTTPTAMTIQQETMRNLVSDILADLQTIFGVPFTSSFERDAYEIRPDQPITQTIDLATIKKLDLLIKHILDTSTVKFTIFLGALDTQGYDLKKITINPTQKTVDLAYVQNNVLTVMGWPTYFSWYKIQPEKITTQKFKTLTKLEPRAEPPLPAQRQRIAMPPQPLVREQLTPTPTGPPVTAHPLGQQPPVAIQELSVSEEVELDPTESQMLETSIKNVQQEHGLSEKLQNIINQLLLIREIRAESINRLKQYGERITELDQELLDSLKRTHPQAKELISKIAESNREVDALIQQERHKADEEFRKLHKKLNELRDEEIKEKKAESDLLNMLATKNRKDIIFKAVEPLQRELIALNELLRYKEIPIDQIEKIKQRKSFLHNQLASYYSELRRKLKVPDQVIYDSVLEQLRGQF